MRFLMDTFLKLYAPPLGLSSSYCIVCRFRRALCGIKLYPRAWYEQFHSITLQIDFKPLTSFSGLVPLLLYMDDLIITGFDFAAISDVK